MCVCLCVPVHVLLQGEEVVKGNRWVAGREEGVSGICSQPASLPACLAVLTRSMSWRKVRSKAGRCFGGEACLGGHFGRH